MIVAGNYAAFGHGASLSAVLRGAAARWGGEMVNGKTTIGVELAGEINGQFTFGA